MKKIFVGSCLLITVVLATDYSSMSLEELQNEREKVTLENKEAYLFSMKKKIELEKATKYSDNQDKDVSNSTARK